MRGVLAAFGALLAGCNPFAEGLRRDNAAERERNRTLTLAALVMKGVETWSAAHYGALPSPEQFRAEVRPPAPPKNDWNFTDADLQAAHRAFVWSFAEGRPPASNVPVGRLAGPKGVAVAYADGSVRRDWEEPPFAR